MVSVKIPVKIAQVSKDKPHTVFKDMKSMFMGRFDQKRIDRILLKSPIDVIPKDMVIMKAKLKIYVQYVGNNRVSEFIPYALAQDWFIDTVNWNNQPTYYSSIKGQGVKITSEGFYSFNITHLVEKWYQGEIPNFGIVLKNDEFINNTKTRVTTIINSSLAPIIEIFYAQKSECECICKNTTFIEKVEDISIDDDYQFSSSIDTSVAKDITFFLQNIGQKDIQVKLQISPDNINYMNNPGYIRLAANELQAFVPTYFTKYLRIAAKNINNDESSTLRIWYQAQK